MLDGHRLGRKILRPLLRSEIGVVSTRRAWHDASKLTQDVLDTYQRPLRVQNWDTALAEVWAYRRFTLIMMSCWCRADVLLLAGFCLLRLPMPVCRCLA